MFDMPRVKPPSTGKIKLLRDGLLLPLIWRELVSTKMTPKMMHRIPTQFSHDNISLRKSTARIEL